MFENLKTIWGADIFILAKEKAHPFPALHVKKTNQNKTQNQIRTKPQNQTKPNKTHQSFRPRIQSYIDLLESIF